MKKVLYLTMLLLCFSIVVVSCKEKEEKGESNSSLAAEKADLAMNDVYQCPMDCEEGKTYDEEGSCPVCKMDLKKKEKEVEHGEGQDKDNEEEHSEEDQDGHDHD